MPPLTVRFAAIALIMVGHPLARAANPDPSKGRPPAVLDARVGVNIRLGNDPAALPAMQRGQAEPHLVRSASNPELLLATFQDGRFSTNGGAVTCGYGISSNGGLSWTRGLIPGLTTINGGPYRRATDPVAAIGPQGDFYLNTLAAIDDAFSQAAVVVSRSTDNGATWSAPVTVFESLNPQIAPDKNWIAANDFPGTATSGRLIVSWSNFRTTGNATTSDISASVSDDRGASWSAPIAITPTGSTDQGSLPVFLPDGSVLVFYATFLGNTPRFDIRCKRSLDGGRTFPASATTVAGLVDRWQDPQLRHGVFLPAAAVARQTGEIFVTYIGLLAPGQPRVFVTRSADQGATWSAPAVASDQPPGVSVMNPAIVVTPDGRSVSVVFMDKRNAPGGQDFVDHYAALSFDGGATWQPNIRLTETSSDIRYGVATPTGVMLGDYLGLAPSLQTDQPCVAIWCDTRNGEADPFTVRFAARPQPDIFAWNLARFDRGATTFFDDGDRDGLSNFWEYVFGSDPRDANSGQVFSLLRAGPNTLDVVWAQRATVIGTGYSLAAATDKNIDELTGALQFKGLVPFLSGVALTPNQLPPIRPPEGLIWRGFRYTFPDGALVGVVRSLTITNGVGLVAEGGPALFNTDSRLINLSTRGRAGADSSQMIVGFVIEGGAKSVLLRAIGPTLAQFGTAGTLADPRLELIFGSLGQLPVFSATNDDWATSPGVSAALFTRLGAFALPATSKDAAIVQTLPPRPYTAIVSGAGNGSGIALVEAYDADPMPGSPGNAQFLNLSTRGEVGVGENALIAGFVVSGTQPRRLLVRAVGPTLAQLGVTGTLADPVLTLFQGNRQVATNDDWEVSRSGAATSATAHRAGAFPLNAASLDAALLITLAPGSYTAVVTSADGTTGIALVEIYDVD